MREWNQFKELIHMTWHLYMRSLFICFMVICIGLYLCDQYFRFGKIKPTQHCDGTSSNNASACTSFDPHQTTQNRQQTPDRHPTRNTATISDDTFSDWYDKSDYYDLYEYYHD